MKFCKTLSLSLILTFSLSSMAEEWHVSTLPSNKNVLVEEFTGVLCGNCPDGHAYVSRLMLAQPEKVHAVSIHSNYYSNAENPALPNFITEEGIEITDYFPVTGFPTGMINRHVFEGNSPVYNRTDWTKHSRTISEEVAPVNLWAGASYVAESKKLKVSVEGYLTSAAEKDLFLNVMLTQNNIMGYQSGAVNYDTYLHQHVLRACLSSTWGDEISAVSEGEYFKKDYEIDLPMVIINTDVEPSELEILAFVTEGKENVLNVVSAKPELIGINIEPYVVIEDYKIPVDRNYGYTFKELYVTNKSTETLTHMVFNVEINGETTETEWEGEIPAFEKVLIRLPFTGWLSDLIDENSYSISCVKANDVDQTSEPVSGKFGNLVEASESLIFKIKTDNFTTDNTFTLRDIHGNLVKEFGPYEAWNPQVYEEEVTLDEGIYCFEITDVWGDGILAPRGNFKIYELIEGEERLLAQNLELTGHGYRLFLQRGVNSAVKEILSEPSTSHMRFTGNRIEVTSQNGVPMTYVYDATGALRISTSKNVIDLTQLKPGVYMAVFTDGIVKEHKKILVK